MSDTSLLQTEFLRPKYWLTWFGIGLIRLMCFLPLHVRWVLGAGLGRLACVLARKRQHIVRTNLQLCFPDLSPTALEELVLDNFKSSGISVIETALVWFEDPVKFRDLVDIEGLDELTQAVKTGKGVMLLGMHLSTLDFCGAVLGTYQPFDVMYRRNKNKLLETVMTRGREKNFDTAIERDNVRQVIRRLKEGAVVWYGPDQDYGRKHSVFAPFFNRQAATITATARIAKMTGSAIVVFSHFRNLESGRYQIRLNQPFDDFPSGDEVSDCARINQVIEAEVSRQPEQYWWLHRRFKTQPEGEPRPY